MTEQHRRATDAAGAALRLRCGTEEFAAHIDTLVIAGWAGRDADAVHHHIEELRQLGVRPPRTTPLFYRLAASLLTTAGGIEVVGRGSTGEAEAVLLSLPGGMFVGVGSDHTDREAEAAGVTWSKQMCAKPIGGEVWRYDEVARHWDALVLSSQVLQGGVWRPYQEGSVAGLRKPDDLVGRYAGAGGLPPGTAMYLGTLPVMGGIAWADGFEVALDDPVLGRRLVHRYAIECLPIAD
jgi:hypothetical protein